MADTQKVLKVLMIAGEASGDLLGGSLLKNLLSQFDGKIDIQGIGGSQMEAQGLNSLFPMSDLSVMGLLEIFPKIPKLLRRIKQTAKAIEHFKPDIVITIDAPDFCFRVVKRVRKKLNWDAQFVHYVAPTVWAWRPGRAKKVAKLYDKILCLFPFEPPYFEKEGMKAFYVGHPATELGLGEMSKKQARDILGVGDRDDALCVLFGSRKGELKRHGVLFANVVKDWLSKSHDRSILIQTLPHLRPQIEGLISGFKDKVIICDKPEDKLAVFAASDKAIAVSGTIGLELSFAKLPHIIAYRANALSFWIFKKLAKIRFAHLVNIMKAQEIIPELIQDKCTHENLLNALEALDIKQQKQDFETIAAEFKPDDGQTAGHMAAMRVLS